MKFELDQCLSGCWYIRLQSLSWPQFIQATINMALPASCIEPELVDDVGA